MIALSGCLGGLCLGGQYACTICLVAYPEAHLESHHRSRGISRQKASRHAVGCSVGFMGVIWRPRDRKQAPSSHQLRRCIVSIMILT
jgi:hypothetical protein